MFRMNCLSKVVVGGILLFSAPASNAEWITVATGISSVRALVVSGERAIIGLSVEGGKAWIWRFDDGALKTVRHLPAPPPLYGYARDARSRELCVGQPRESGGGVTLDCFSFSKGAVNHSGALPLKMASGALLEGRAWIVHSHAPAAPLVEIEKEGTEWMVVRKLASPLCAAGRKDCGELEIHPMPDGRLAVVQLYGQIDEAYRYREIGIMDPRNGKLWRRTVPSLKIPREFASAYRSFHGQDLRLIFRSAVSPGGHFGLIVETPGDLNSPPRRDQLWLYRPNVGWSRVRAPESLTAIAFDGPTPVVATRDGRILRWNRAE